MSSKEAQEKLVANLKNWKKVENASVASTGRIIEKTTNPILRLVMEIIQRDSQLHYRVQDMIIDTIEGGKAVSLSPDEMADVWGMVEEHLKLEQETIELAKNSLEALKGRHMKVQSYLLEYLLADEEKHEKLLQNLEAIQKGMYPYG
jgi:hypothetical protein